MPASAPSQSTPSSTDTFPPILSRSSSPSPSSSQSKEDDSKYLSDYIRPREVVWINVDGSSWKMAVVKSGPYTSAQMRGYTCPLLALSALKLATFWRVHFIDETEHVWSIYVSAALCNVLPDTSAVRDYLRATGSITGSNVTLTRGVPRVMRTYMRKADALVVCGFCKSGEMWYWEQVFRLCAGGDQQCLKCMERCFLEQCAWYSTMR
ncbi:hypothetical protein EW145_g4658 [Phellinidium pouzarii]|uniref:Uncharacterized protein n=1 Tax=Phellinidium pouzarii TaxID=167371 RepID=A0A4S4L2W5_9AGAM|nr:hypothetical protein EW145_g4658 [Phellinidium pouzarii]